MLMSVHPPHVKIMPLVKTTLGSSNVCVQLDSQTLYVEQVKHTLIKFSNLLIIEH